MRKLGFGFLSLLLIGVIYYFTLGKAQLIAEVKQQVDTELTLLQKEGFKVENRKTEKNSDYFELTLEDSQKALAFFRAHGVAVDASDLLALEGIKFGIGLQYLPDSYTSVALDIIPLSLPTHLSKEATASQKKTLEALQKLLDKKAIAIHIAVNKTGDGFKGNLKDIDEIIQTEDKTHFILKNFTFQGTLENQKLHTFSQHQERLSIDVAQEFNSTLNNLNGNYENKGNGYKNLYTFDSFNIHTAKSNITLTDVTMDTLTTVEHELASIDTHNHIDHINVDVDNKDYLLEDINFSYNVQNLDITAFEKLQKINPENKEVLTQTITQLLSKGVAFTMPALSVGYITLDKEKIKGFDIVAHFDIDKNIPVAALSDNIMAVLPYVDAELKVSLSPSLMGHIAQRPEVILAMMIFRPQDKDGKKVYQIELKNGKALLNGKPIF